MALRLLEIITSSSKKNRAEEILKKHERATLYKSLDLGNSSTIQIILAAEDSEALMDAMEKEFSDDKGFRIALFPLEAVLPRIPEEKKKSPTVKKEKKSLMRVSREELFHDIEGHTRLSPLYLWMVFLSAVVATIGILYENTAAIIGAMVIAPLLGPNVALSFATTLGDLRLAKKAILVNVTGLLLALGISLALGWFMPIQADNAEILIRTQARPGDIVLALAVGCAGTLAFTSGAPGALIGVMVAVALLPPLVTLGLMLATLSIPEAYGAALLLFTNVICINLAGVLTFWAQGVRPLSWWEAGKAKKATIVATLLWSAMLAVFIFLVLLSWKTSGL